MTAPRAHHDSGSLWLGALTVFATRTGGLFLTAATTFILARVLGPSELGGYYLLILVPTSMLALASFGLPAAITFAVGRGEDLDRLRTVAIVLALGLATVIVVVLFILQGLLRATVLAAAPMDLFPLTLLAIPGLFVIAFANAIVLGRQRLRRYNVVLLGQSAALFVGQVVVVVVARGGLVGALSTYVAVITGIAVAAAISAATVAPFRPAWDGAIARDLVSFGIKLQPASLASFFSYRADVFLLSIFLRDPAVVGIYSLAVNLAELCFYVPDAVSTVLFPRVAASDRAGAAAFVPVVCRTALLLTTAAAAALALGALVLFPVVLPSFVGSIPPALILLPGIVGLSASKVLSGYLQGIGRPGPVSAVATTSLAVNLGANLLLIPLIGINGAAAASLLSYSLNGGAMLYLSARQAGVRRRDMVLARTSDLALLRDALPWLARRRSSAT